MNEDTPLTRCQISTSRAVAGLLLVNIVGTDMGNGVRLIAVQINQTLEPVLFAGIEQPVDGPLLINLAVFGIKIAP